MARAPKSIIKLNKCALKAGLFGSIGNHFNLDLLIYRFSFFIAALSGGFGILLPSQIDAVMVVKL